MNYEGMIVSNRIFIDTAPFIYLIENHPNHYSKVSKFITDEYATNEASLVTSTITLAEFFVKPKLHSDTKTIHAFNTALTNLNVFVSSLSKEIAEHSAELRAKYRFLKGFDAVQLATALHNKCNLLFTNDKVFKRTGVINSILVDDLKK
jgi:predicted nucleic acid-binding protein